MTSTLTQRTGLRPHGLAGTLTGRETQPERAEISALSNMMRSAEAGYRQSHPLSFMATAADLNTDQANLSNNYMKLIFGGADQEKDAMHLAYNHALRQMAEAPVTKDSLLGQQNPLSFVEGEPATKDSLLRTFAEQRQYYEGQIDTDAERALKTRATHLDTHFTYYGKDQGRFNHVYGQAHLLHRPTNLENFRPFGNISSRTYAPDGEGGEVPLDFALENDFDPRAAPIEGREREVNSQALQDKGFQDLGPYSGNEWDNVAALKESTFNAPSGFEHLFEVKKRDL